MTFRTGLAIVAAALLTACGSNFSYNSSDGVPLAELDTAGAMPTGIALAGPDRVVVSSGDALSIEVDGDADAAEGLRFELTDDTLRISREGRLRGSGATVRVTMPTPTDLSLAGSGTIELDRLGTGDDAAVSIAGSGESRVARIDAGTLSVDLAGSGGLRAAGRARTLDLSIAGSGDLDLRELEVGDADISIAGSGNAVFASDGTVDASIMGSGDVEVIGNASCSVNSMGSGHLRCTPRPRDGSAGTAQARE